MIQESAVEMDLSCTAQLYVTSRHVTNDEEGNYIIG
jgi:hypothetical protein